MKSATAGASAAFIALGAAAAIGIVKAIDSVVTLAREVKGLQRVTGQTAESASALIAIGNTFGVGVDKLSVGLGLFEKNIVNNSKNLTKYGLSLRDAGGKIKPFDALLGEAADKFNTLPTAADRAAFAMNVFGRSGKTLIPILQLGSVGIARMGEEAKKLGVVISQDTVDKALALSRAEREFGEAIKGAAVSIGTQFLPVATALVNEVIGLVEAFTRLPGPLKAGTLAFFALSGAIVAVVKVSQFFAGIWAPIGKAVVGAVVGVYGYIAALVSLAATEGIAATASYVLGTALDFALGPIGLVIAGVTILAGAFLSTRQNTAAYEKEITNLAVSLARGSDALGAFNARLANSGLSADLQQRVRDKVAIDAQVAALELQSKAQQLAQRTGITYSAALAIVTATAQDATVAIDSMNKATASLDLTALLSATPKVQDQIVQFAATGGAALDQFAKVSGQSVDTIKGDFAKLTDLTKATSGDVVKTIADMKAAWQGWHDQLVANFGGASGALSAFEGKNKVSFGSLNTSLQTYIAHLQTFRADFKRLATDPSSKQFLQAASEGGLQWLGILNAVAGQAPKARAKFFQLFNSANSQTTSLASVIQHQLIPKFDQMINRLTTIANALGGHYKLRVDTGAASAALDRLQAKILALTGGTVSIDVHTGAKRPVGGGEHGAFIPGLAAGGFVATEGLLRVGEKNKPEMVLPLSDPSGHRALVAALRDAGSRDGAGGRYAITITNWDTGTGYMTQLARHEVDDQAAHLSALARMR